jgi:hypothetical protein
VVPNDKSIVPLASKDPNYFMEHCIHVQNAQNLFFKGYTDLNLYHEASIACLVINLLNLTSNLSSYNPF